MIIDAHNHVGPEIAEWELTYVNYQPPEVLIKKMDANKIDMAVIFTGAGNTLKGISLGNDYIYNASGQYQRRLIPFMTLNPRFREKAIQEISRCVKKELFKGIKIDIDVFSCPANSDAMAMIFESAEEYSLPVGVHSSHSDYSHPLIIADIANDFPNVDVIMQHMAGCTSAAVELQSIKAAKKNKNILLDTSFSTPYAIKKAIDTIGVQRILFGSDTMIQYQMQYEKPKYEMYLKMQAVKVLNLPSEQEEKILGGNAARLFGIEV